MKANYSIDEIIKSGHECEYLDYKAEVYKNNEALIKDIMAMANSKYNGNKFIVIGVKDYVNGSREVVGVAEEELVDQASYQQLILSNIEPDINFRFYPYEFNGKLLGIF